MWAPFTVFCIGHKAYSVFVCSLGVRPSDCVWMCIAPRTKKKHTSVYIRLEDIRIKIFYDYLSEGRHHSTSIQYAQLVQYFNQRLSLQHAWTYFFPEMYHLLVSLTPSTCYNLTNIHVHEIEWHTDLDNYGLSLIQFIWGQQYKCRNTTSSKHHQSTNKLKRMNKHWGVKLYYIIKDQQAALSNSWKLYMH